MWQVILVDPGHGGAGRDCEGCRPETEVIDLDLVLSVVVVIMKNEVFFFASASASFSLTATLPRCSAGPPQYACAPQCLQKEA